MTDTLFSVEDFVDNNNTVTPEFSTKSQEQFVARLSPKPLRARQQKREREAERRGATRALAVVFMCLWSVGCGALFMHWFVS